MQSKTYTDFEAFAESVKDVDARMMFQNPKSRVWIINHVYLPGVHVQLGRLGSGNIVEGQSWSNGYLLYLPLTGNCEYQANGTTAARGSIVILEPGCEFCVATRTEHDWCTILIPTHRLTDGGTEPSAHTEKMVCRVNHANLGAAREIQRLVFQVLNNAVGNDEFEGSPAVAHVEAELVNLASQVVRSSPEKERNDQIGRRPLPRQEMIHRCQEHLDKYHTQPIHIDELVNVAGVSARTLQRAFHDYFGIGPKRYLQLRQLHQVHDVLKASDPAETSVSKTLFDHGVHELGRFAHAYRTAFDELPSDTLRNTRR